MATTVQLAGMLPRDPDFRVWMSQFVTMEVTEELAVEFIRLVCEVDSRREIETNPNAETRFHECIRKQFVAWKRQR